MRFASFFLLSVVLHAAPLAYPGNFRARDYSTVIAVTVLPPIPQEASPQGGNAGNSATTARAGETDAPVQRKKSPRPAPSRENNPINLNPARLPVGAAPIETPTESSVAVISLPGVSAEGSLESAFEEVINPGLVPDTGGVSSGGESIGSGARGSSGGTKGYGSAFASVRSANLTQARYRETPRPEYPESARRAGREGRVLLRVLVDEQGKSQRVEINSSSGNEALDRAAADAIRRWRFDPARYNDRPVESWLRIPIEFRLMDARK